MSSPQTGPGSGQHGAEAKHAEEQKQAPEQQQKQWAMTSAPETTAMSGWLTFAGSLILLVGIFNIIEGLTSLFRTDYFIVGEGQLLVFNFATWGTILLVLGVLQVATGVGCMYEQTWARTSGIVLAALCAIGHLAFLAAFPLWSLLVIALSVLVIYGLVVPEKNTAS
ncbi:hypothetical protein SAMN05421805_12659 [Saccharopolyspora antimicrobica]|uniref:DUF7144 domain-containing protein n=1 Tax=Saccharopolyspora antimicrobica TaxID=455193 RepID=A0A1I5KDK0_9PSEU|nr:hypothetical protein [Saccharopolyspora antimicrobica]RKT81947.1 hypothetical protein ATL45_0186 [Saccharopolyspora antimicrobica]SFO82691.1 hypothetical protein SAMN05421805_12659 [Saccharopolyspora antimicrobica]